MVNSTSGVEFVSCRNNQCQNRFFRPLDCQSGAPTGERLEIFLDANAHFAEVDKDELEKTWKAFKRGSFLPKCQSALKLKGKDELAPGDSVYQNTKLLIDIRNAITHFHPGWSDGQGEHKDIEEELKSKSLLTPFFLDGLFFPSSCMSHVCASWCVQTALAFEDFFNKKSGLPARFDPFKDKLDTAPPT